jgi:glutaredoxin
MTLLRGAGLLIVLALACTTQALAMYRWVDKNGGVHYSDQPPPPDARKIEQPKLNINVLDTSGLPYATRRAMENFPVRLFTSPKCKRPCERAREFLKQRGVPYSETSVTSAQSLASFKKIFKAKPFVPALAVGDQTQTGFSESGWNSMLDSAGYPRSVPPGTKAGPVGGGATQAPAAAPGSAK